MGWRHRNGGFEEVAPFGGFGWRYYTGAGVERITTAPDAYEGTAFLRLSQEANVHQPATNGQTIDVSLWARGASCRRHPTTRHRLSGSSHVEYATRPRGPTTELDTDWTQVQFTVTAPAETKRPIFTRLTLLAGEDSTVDIDGIEMTTK